MKTKQVFKKVARHLLTQMEKSENDSNIGCYYRLPDTSFSCAVGCLITDEHYREDLEGLGVEDSDIIRAVSESLGQPVGHKDVKFLSLLQSIHDYASVDLWEDELNTVALEHFDKTLEELGVQT